MKINESTRSPELAELCRCVRRLADEKEYEKCSDLICNAMMLYPCAPHPHNLMGIILERTGCHAAAMRHFRAASDLDPTYAPARQNLTTYGTFYSSGNAAFDETDCSGARDARYEVSYEGGGMGRMLRRKCS